MNYIYGFFGGRSTFFAFVFTVGGLILAFQGRLSSVYVGLVSAVQTLVVFHSTKEDYHERASDPIEIKPEPRGGDESGEFGQPK